MCSVSSIHITEQTGTYHGTNIVLSFGCHGRDLSDSLQDVGPFSRRVPVQLAGHALINASQDTFKPTDVPNRARLQAHVYAGDFYDVNA